ncbi:MAG: hypothetical protein AAF889_11185 [Cyanobacteria bacterium P01_D01_bin.73]
MQSKKPEPKLFPVPSYWRRTIIVPSTIAPSTTVIDVSTEVSVEETRRRSPHTALSLSGGRVRRKRRRHLRRKRAIATLSLPLRLMRPPLRRLMRRLVTAATRSHIRSSIRGGIRGGQQ